MLLKTKSTGSVLPAQRVQMPVGLSRRPVRLSRQAARTCKATAAAAEEGEPIDKPTVAAEVETTDEPKLAAAPAVVTVQEWVPKILAFAIPALISTLIGPILSMIDTAYVGQGGLVDLAALAPGTLISDVTQFVFSWLGVGTIQIMSPYVADRDLVAMEKITRTAVVLAVVSGVVVCAWHTLCVGGLLASVKTPQVLVEKASSYVTIRAMGFPVAFLNTAIWGVCLANRDTLTPLVISLLSMVLNLVGDYYLCVVCGQGIAGAAWATIVAQYISALAYPVLLLSRKKTYLNKLIGPVDGQYMGKFAAFALPSMFVTTATLSVYGVMTWVANVEGVVVAAAGKVIASVFQFLAFCGEPMFQTMTAMLPRNNPESKGTFIQAVTTLSGITGVVTGLIAIVVTLFGAGIFTSDPQVAGEMVKVVWPVFFSLLLIIPSRCLQGLCMANGDFLYWAGMTAINAILFAAACTYTTVTLGAGYVGMWWVHVGLYVVTMAEFTWRAVQPPKPKAVAS